MPNSLWKRSRKKWNKTSLALEPSPRGRPYDNNMEYSIGEFATLMNVTVKALHHYEKIGLLKPARIDQLTGYRKYDSSQFEIMMQVREYQGLGLTLAGIKRVIVDDVDDDTFESILRSKQGSLHERIMKDLETYSMLAARLGAEDDLSQFAAMQSTRIIMDCIYPMPPGVSGCLRPFPPIIEGQEKTSGPKRTLLSISTRLASRTVGNLKQTTQELAERLLLQNASETLKQQIWYWIETTDDPSEGPFRMHAGLEESVHFTGRTDLIKINFMDSGMAFTGHDFSALGVGQWKKMTQHVHHEMFNQAVLPVGPFFVQLNEKSLYSRGSLAYQGGMIDESIVDYEANVEDEGYADGATNPFAHWHTNM